MWLGRITSMLIAPNYVTKSLCIVTDGDLVGKATDLFVECCGCYRPHCAKHPKDLNLFQKN